VNTDYGMLISMYVAVYIRTAVMSDRGLCTLVSAVIKVPCLILIFVLASYAMLFDYSVVTRLVCRLYAVIY